MYLKTLIVRRGTENCLCEELSLRGIVSSNICLYVELSLRRIPTVRNCLCEELFNNQVLSLRGIGSAKNCLCDELSLRDIVPVRNCICEELSPRDIVPVRNGLRIIVRYTNCAIKKFSFGYVNGQMNLSCVMIHYLQTNSRN